jgi:hypothetical protein
VLATEKRPLFFNAKCKGNGKSHAICSPNESVYVKLKKPDHRQDPALGEGGAVASAGEIFQLFIHI